MISRELLWNSREEILRQSWA